MQGAPLEAMKKDGFSRGTAALRPLNRCIAAKTHLTQSYTSQVQKVEKRIATWIYLHSVTLELREATTFL